MHTVYLLKSHDNLFNVDNIVLLTVSPSNYENFNYMHYKEQYLYFFPSKTITVVLNETLKNNEVLINNASNVEYNNKYEYFCTKRSFFCPLNSDGNIIIYY